MVSYDNLLQQFQLNAVELILKERKMELRGEHYRALIFCNSQIELGQKEWN